MELRLLSLRMKKIRRKIIVKIIGEENYINRLVFISQLYRSFLPFKNRAKIIIKRHMISAGAIVIDIGANIGRFTSLASSLVKKSGEVHSFEPVDISFRILKKSIRLKRFHNVVLNNVALSDKNGVSDISIPLAEGWKPKLPVAHMGVDSRATLKQEILVKKLDDYCEEKRICRIDFIKCDTEGHEFFTFSGGLKCLSKYKPSVLCEIYRKYCERQGVNPAQVFELFYSIGYKSYIPTKEGLLIYVEGYKKPADYFFIHPSKLSNDLLENIMKINVE